MKRLAQFAKFAGIVVVIALVLWKIWEICAPHLLPELTDKGPWPYTTFEVKVYPPYKIKVHAFRLPPGSHKGIGTDSTGLEVLWYYRYAPTHLNLEDHASIIEHIPFPMPASFKRELGDYAGECQSKMVNISWLELTYIIFDKSSNAICSLTLPRQWVNNKAGYYFNWMKNKQGKKIIIFVPEHWGYISHKFIFGYIEFLEQPK